MTFSPLCPAPVFLSFTVSATLIEVVHDIAFGVGLLHKFLHLLINIFHIQQKLLEMLQVSLLLGLVLIGSLLTSLAKASHDGS